MDIAKLRRSLLGWFRRAKRSLPWRSTRDPYAIWVSETMLQQTTVAAVIPYYERFMARFPNLEALASSDEDAVLAQWSGLGYYSRARNLRLAAQNLIANRHGRFPTTVAEAMTLEGVGRYTASAVTSIAFGTRAAVVDGNVRRVIARLHALSDLPEARSQELATDLLSSRSPGAWNEAMMELGATICTPRQPLCDRCPISSECRGCTRPEHWSSLKPRRQTVVTPVEMALVERGGKILLARVPKGQLMGGLCELPHAGLVDSEASGLAARFRGVLALDGERHVATVRHAMTHHRITARVFRARLIGSRAPAGHSFHTLAHALTLPLGGLTRKALRAAGLV